MKGAKQKHDGTAEQTKSIRVKASTHKKMSELARVRKINIVDLANEAFEHFVNSGMVDALFPKK